MKGRLWNAKRFIVFQTIILKRTMEVQRAQNIRQQVKRRIVEWKEGHYRMLVEDTTRTSRAMISKVARGVSKEVILNTFNSLLLIGKIRTAVHFVTL